MAKKCFEDQNPLCCSICLDQLQDNNSHGHNYCLDCIKDWDAHGSKETSYSCPQCRKTFTPRPVLNKNTCMFAEMVERFKNTGLRDSSPTHFHGSGPTECKICTAQKTNTLKVCPECEDLRCKTHPCHRFNDHTREKHTVIVVSADYHGNIFSRHNRLLGVYCRTDQQFICTLCLKDAHRGHEAFSMMPEKNGKTPEHRRPMAKKAHRGKSKTSGHGKRKSNKIMHGTGHRHSGGHTRVSHANSGHETVQQKSSGRGVHSHGHSHGVGRRKSRDGGHGDLITGHGHDRKWL
ncbi:E3 ubiquitin/ISG15 ligase TRIM25 [Triplophysa rosa]|uniref:E3 ubiquitin/ISG15 ligase TRIM25-like n=1 Tax=Triplophysa rosa TaxID=992332 RepID=UPI002545D21C|nr:E3 ubiquitin/ISG15 ligase TRIM25-like [Triplophysa rosa]XP_057202830.1 E3 ubiquitin/ISG15 ligase TRIM25 [Triplophysa rosa]